MTDEVESVMGCLDLYRSHDERYDWIIIMRMKNGNVMVTKDTAMMDAGDTVIARVRPDDYVRKDDGEMREWVEDLLLRGPG